MNKPAPLSLQELNQIYQALDMVSSALNGQPVKLFTIGETTMTADTLQKQLHGEDERATFYKAAQIATIDHLKVRVSSQIVEQMVPRWT